MYKIKYHGKTKEELLAILSQFDLQEKVVSAEPFGNGHINDTLKVTTEKGEIKYVLQRINHLVFTNVDMLQHNIHVVTMHIREKLVAKGETDIDRKVLTFCRRRMARIIILTATAIGVCACLSREARATKKLLRNYPMKQVRLSVIFS